MSQERRYSFEFFPTKTDAGHEKLMGVARQLAGIGLGREELETETAFLGHQAFL